MAKYLLLINDEDAGGPTSGGHCYFRNVRLWEMTSPPSESTVDYAYDADDLRVARTMHFPGTEVPQYFVYEGDQVAMRFDWDGNLTNRFLYGPGTDQVVVDEVFDTLGAQPLSDEVLWYLPDHQGTIRDIVDDNGTLRKHTDYDSFGQVTGEAYYDQSGVPTAFETVGQSFYYTGREWDDKADAYYNRRRWYGPDAARFLSEDPSGFDGGDPNLYRYVGNSPDNATDPTGLRTLKPYDTLPALGSTKSNPFSTISYATPNFNLPSADDTIRQLTAPKSYDYY